MHRGRLVMRFVCWVAIHAVAVQWPFNKYVTIWGHWNFPWWHDVSVNKDPECLSATLSGEFHVYFTCLISHALSSHWVLCMINARLDYVISASNLSRITSGLFRSECLLPFHVSSFFFLCLLSWVFCVSFPSDCDTPCPNLWRMHKTLRCLNTEGDWNLMLLHTEGGVKSSTRKGILMMPVCSHEGLWGLLLTSYMLCPVEVFPWVFNVNYLVFHHHAVF